MYTEVQPATLFVHEFKIWMFGCKNVRLVAKTNILTYRCVYRTRGCPPGGGGGGYEGEGGGMKAPLPLLINYGGKYR